MEKKDNRRYVRLNQVKTYPSSDERRRIKAILIGSAITILLMGAVFFGLYHIAKALGPCWNMPR